MPPGSGPQNGLQRRGHAPLKICGQCRPPNRHRCRKPRRSKTRPRHALKSSQTRAASVGEEDCVHPSPLSPDPEALGPPWLKRREEATLVCLCEPALRALLLTAPGRGFLRSTALSVFDLRLFAGITGQYTSNVTAKDKMLSAWQPAAPAFPPATRTMC